MDTPIEMEDLSVIVVTHNNTKTIECVLESLYFQLPPPLEVLIVDEDSEDDMCGLIKSFEADRYPFQLKFHTKNDMPNLKIVAGRVLITSGDQLYAPNGLTGHMQLKESVLGRGMVRKLVRELSEYNPTVNLPELAEFGMCELLPSSFSVGTTFFRNATTKPISLLSNDFIQKLISLGVGSRLLTSVAYKMKIDAKEVLDLSYGPLGNKL